MIMDKGSFGRWLKNERECRGVALAAIAKSTKIRLPLLAGLERGDLTDWPLGVYRRDFFRQYVTAIGLPAEPLVAQFTHLYAEGVGPAPSTAMVEASDDGGTPRLRLAGEREWWRVGSSTTGMLAGIVEWCAALGLVAVVIRFLDANLWVAAALLASVHCLVVIGLGHRLWLSWRDVQIRQKPGTPVLGVVRFGSASPDRAAPIPAATR